MTRQAKTKPVLESMNRTVTKYSTMQKVYKNYWKKHKKSSKEISEKVRSAKFTKKGSRLDEATDKKINIAIDLTRDPFEKDTMTTRAFSNTKYSLNNTVNPRLKEKQK